jgi:hypothetical protein
MSMISRYNWRNVHISSLREWDDIQYTRFFSSSVNLAFLPAQLQTYHKRKFARHYIIPANVTLEWLSFLPACCNYEIISSPIMS